MDGTGLHVESAGAGDPVLFLHGVANSSRTYGWLDLADCRTVRVDFRGHGASPHAANPGTRRSRSCARSARWQADGIDETTAAARLAAMPERAGRTAVELETEHALGSRAYALLHLGVEVIDPVVDGSALAGIDRTSPVKAPVFILAADDALGDGVPLRAPGAAGRLPSTRPCGAGRRRRASIHDERANRDAYLEQLRAFREKHAVAAE